MLAIAFISCSMLMYEILLTRLCSLRLFFHFGYLIISNCLLGLGASGTLIFLFQRPWQERRRLAIATSTVLYLVSLVLAYLFVLKFHLPYTRIFSDWGGIGRFFLFNLVTAGPFFFAGGAVGMILTFHSQGVNRIYFADLLGAGVGCLISPFLLKTFGAGGCLIVLMIWGVLGALVLWPPRTRALALAAGCLVIVAGLVLLPRFEQWFPVPGKDQMDLTDRQAVPLARRVIASTWSVNSRIDVTPLFGEKFMFNLGTNRQHLPAIPDEIFIGQDGSAGTYQVNFSDHPEALPLIENSLYSASLRLKKEPRVFIIGVGGGNDVWAARANNASYVKAIELNAAILDVHYKVNPSYTRLLTGDPRIHLVCDEGRSALIHDRSTYDVIQMTGIDTWAALASGAYILAENYLYTKEAIQGMYDHLAPGGVLQITRMAADMESLRLVANIDAALRERGVASPDASLICLRAGGVQDVTGTAMIKKGAFTPEEIEKTHQFAQLNGLKEIYLPGRKLNNVVEQFILTGDKDSFIRDFPRNISPTTDDKPYFFNYSKWSQPLRERRYASEPSYISQGNPFFLFMQLAVSLLLSLLLIVLPLLAFRRAGMDWTGGGRTLIYFAGLGLAFIGIEVAAIQKLTLFLGLPIYSLVVSLASLLIFTGLGSLLSTRFPLRRGAKIWLIPGGIAVLLLLFVFFSQRLIGHFFGQPLPARILLAVLALAPLGLLLGVPFSFGVRTLNAVNAKLIPWAWAINACCTVIGSILTVIISMNFGFYVVLVLAAVIYIVAFAALHGLLPGKSAAAPLALREKAKSEA